MDPWDGTAQYVVSKGERMTRTIRTFGFVLLVAAVVLASVSRFAHIKRHAFISEMLLGLCVNVAVLGLGIVVTARLASLQAAAKLNEVAKHLVGPIAWDPKLVSLVVPKATA